VIVSCGYLNVDVRVGMRDLPAAGARVQASFIERSSGGMAANVAVAIARLGVQSHLVAAVGSDPDGTRLVEELAAERVEVASVATDRRTTWCIVLVSDNGERVLISEDDTLTGSDIARARGLAFELGGWLTLDGYRWPAAAPLLREARPMTFTDIDGCTRAEHLESAASASDHVLGSRAHLATVLGSDPRDAARNLVARYGTTVVLTEGRVGWWMCSPNGVQRGSGLDVPVDDTTGAGDAFLGAYTASLWEGADPVEAARFANVAAACSVSAGGARAGLPTRKIVDRLCAAQSSSAQSDQGSCS
jgi:sulfofructose kinase